MKLTSGPGVFIRTHIFRDGPLLRATTYIVKDGQPHVLNFAVNLQTIEKRIAAYHRQLQSKDGLVVGFGWGSLSPKKMFRGITRAAKKIGRGKLLKTIAKGTKSILKSKTFGAVVALTAVAIPAVGVPALAAYAAANAALSATEKGVAAAKAIPGFKEMTTTQKRKHIDALPELKKVFAQALKSQKFFKNIRAFSRYGQDPQQKEAAKKLSHIVTIVAKHRDHLRQISTRFHKEAEKGMKGLVINNAGQLLKGNFIKSGLHKGVMPVILLANKNLHSGNYVKIGCNGCMGTCRG
jgi:hypothetical protein